MRAELSLCPWQAEAIHNPYNHFAMIGGIACVSGETRLLTPEGKKRISDLQAGDVVASVTPDGQPIWTLCNAPFVKGRTRLWEVVHEHGRFVAHGRHLVLDESGNWQCVDTLDVGTGIQAFLQDCSEGVPRCFYKFLSSQVDYPDGKRSCDRSPIGMEGKYLSNIRQLVCAKISVSLRQHLDDRSALEQAHIRGRLFHTHQNLGFYPCATQGSRFDNEQALGGPSLPCGPVTTNNRLPLQLIRRNDCRQSRRLLVPSRIDSAHRCCGRDFHKDGGECPNGASALTEPPSEEFQTIQRFQCSSDCHPIDVQQLRQLTGQGVSASRILSIRQTEPMEYWDIHIPETGCYVAEGAVHHNTGKTFTGSQFAITQMITHPQLTGAIGANTYDQLSQATLRELFYWLDYFGLEYVSDCKPPPHWGAPKRFKDYNNILSVRVGKDVATVFTRVMSNGDALRGLEFSWYWIDESRDTPMNTHDIILSRLRESNHVKGLITTTPAGEDWVWNRFIKNYDSSSLLYGYTHVQTRKSVQYGVISRDFYMALRRSYSPQMAAQELDAKHVVVREGRAYYTYDDRNKEYGFVPNPMLPLIIGMDFNFQPAPMCWAIGQYDDYEEKMHWFDELTEAEISSREMARRLAERYGDFFLRIFGDASGNRGTTSNAGETDYAQIADELAQAGVNFTIDTDQANPLVRDRVENMCRLGCDANGDVWQFVDPDRCPLLWQDLTKVVWKNGKLSADGAEEAIRHLLTHCSDGAGYAMMKVAPPTVGPVVMGLRVASANNPMAASM